MPLKSFLFTRLLLTFCLCLGLAQVHAEEKGDSGDGLEGIVTDFFFDSEPDLDIPTGFVEDLVDGRWIKPKVGYGYEFRNHPTDPDRYIRKENLKLNLTLPLNLVNNLPAAIGPQLKAEFIRPFYKKPITDLATDFFKDEHPYGPKKVPHNHKRALRLAPEDYYSFTANLALSLTPGTAKATGLSFTTLNAFVRYVVSGDFKVEVYKLTKTKVKVIASSMRSRAFGADLKARFVPDIDVFGIKVVDKLISGQFKADLINWEIFEKRKGNLFSVSYIYDLSTEEGKKAYDALMDPREWKRPSLQFSKNVGGTLKSQDRLFWMADISESAGYAIKGTPGVEHVNQSELEFIQKKRGIGIDLIIADASSHRHYMEVDYAFQGEAGGDEEHYRFANLAVYKEHDFLFNSSEAKVRREATAVFDINENRQITDFRELHFLYRREDKKLKEGLLQKEASAILGHFRKMLPPRLWGLKGIEFQDVLRPAYKKKKGVIVQMEMSYMPEALDIVSNMTPVQIINEVDRFFDETIPLLAAKDKKKNLHYGVLEMAGALNNLKQSDNVENYFSELKINKIKDGLIAAFRKSNSPKANQERWEIFQQLQQSVIFRDLGSAILARMLEKAAILYNDGKMNNLVFFRAHAKVEGEKQQESITAGLDKRPDATKALISKKDRVMNRSYNPYHFNLKK